MPQNTPLGDLTLHGYDLYKLGHRSTPNTPLHPGDPLHLVAYWTLNEPGTPLKNELLIQMITGQGQAGPEFGPLPLAGVGYDLSQWQPGELIRAQYDLFLPDVEPGLYRLTLTVDNGEETTVTLTQPFQVE